MTLDRNGLEEESIVAAWTHPNLETELAKLDSDALRGMVFSGVVRTRISGRPRALISIRRGDLIPWVSSSRRELHRQSCILGKYRDLPKPYCARTCL